MLRLLSDTSLDGPEHMALDEALLRTPGPPTIRLYTWRRATVSLGYFQDYAAIAAGLPTTMPMVRRITGGGAIWHEHEFTYAVVAATGTVLPARSADCYPLLHGAIAAALARRGAHLEQQTASIGDHRYRDEPRCFASPAADDLVCAAGKVLGSAGRCRQGRMLVHGSLKLASNPWDGGVVAGCGLDAGSAREALCEGLIRALGGEAEAGELSAAERQRWRELLDLRYGDGGWVERREGPRP